MSVMGKVYRVHVSVSIKYIGSDNRKIYFHRCSRWLLCFFSFFFFSLLQRKKSRFVIAGKQSSSFTFFSTILFQLHSYFSCSHYFEAAMRLSIRNFSTDLHIETSKTKNSLLYLDILMFKKKKNIGKMINR